MARLAVIPRILPLICATLFAAACSQSSGSGPAAPAAPRGEQLYSQNCAPCHQQEGGGVPNVYPSLKASPAVLGDPVELARWVLSQKRPASIPAGRYPTQMLLFGWMKDEDAAALFTYIRSHFGNEAPAVDAATVEKAR